MKHLPSRRLPSLALIAPLALLAGACGGGGSGPGSGGGLEEGELDIESFGYEDPHAPGFHPLGDVDVTHVARRDETFVFSGDHIQGTTLAWYVDDGLTCEDPDEDCARNPGGWQEADASGDPLRTGVVHDGIAADVDGDGRSEVVWVLQDAPETAIRVQAVYPDGTTLAPGPYVQVHRPSDATGVRARVALGDLDGDGLAEVALTLMWGGRPGQLFVFDDLPSGAGLLFERTLDTWSFLDSGDLYDAERHRGAGVFCLQLDEDEPLELVAAGFAGGEVHYFDDLQTGLIPLHQEATGQRYAQTAAGDFDGDGRDETIVWSTDTWGVSSDTRSQVVLVDDALADFSARLVEDPFYLGILESARLEAAVAADVDGDGADELACVVKAHFQGRLGLHSYIDLLEGQRWDGGGPRSSDIGAVLSKGDRNADLREEVDFAYLDGRQIRSGTVDWREDTEVPRGVVVRYDTRTTATYVTPRLASVTADFDQDSSSLRYTGDKELRLGPVAPIVLIAAPPTRAGVGQNVEDTTASYGIAQSTEEAYTVETGVSTSFSVGFEVEDPLGLFGTSGRVGLERALAASNTSATTVEVSRSFLAGHDQDVVVFQATLYHVYQYEILSSADPLAVGRLVAVEVPVSTRVYKWSLDFFNANVRPEERLEPELLGHTIGDPATYPTLADAERIANRADAYRTPSISTPQDRAPSAIGFSVSEATSEGNQLSYGVTSESELKVAGGTFGVSQGLTRDELWTVTVAETTAFEAQIGGIPDPGRWADWHYHTGLLVYVLEREGRPPHHVLHTWTDPTGAAYGE